jgi:hypothetical protein
MLRDTLIQLLSPSGRIELTVLNGDMLSVGGEFDD